MAESPLTLQTAWSSFVRGGYRPTETSLIYNGRLQKSRGRLPVVFCHGFGATPGAQFRSGIYVKDFRSLSGQFPILIGELGGVTTWGNDDSIDAVDDILTFYSNLAATPVFGVQTERVAVYGESMGCLTALNWAWRNPDQIAAVVLRAPLVAMDAFHDRNAGGFAGAMESAYGGLAAYDAAVPTHDPMANLDLIRPFGDRIKLWAMASDTLIPPSEVEAFAALVGAEVVIAPGGHADAVTIDPGGPTIFIIETTRSRRSLYWDWQSGWDQLTRVPITLGSLITYDYFTDVAVGGRRGFAVSRSGAVPSNDRAVHLFPGFQAVDSEMFTTIYSSDPLLGGQQGNFHRVIYDLDADTAAAYVLWQNVFFSTPWIINVGVWVWQPTTAATGTGTLDINQTGSFTPVGLVKQTGAIVLASSRTANVVTLICAFEQRPLVGDIIDVHDLTESSFNGPHFVESITEDTVTYTVAGADVTSGGSGYFGNLIRAFPYKLRTQVRGTTAYIKAWKGDEEPSWDNPDFATSIAFEAGHHTGFGANGILVAHAQVLNRAISQGFVAIGEL